MEKDKNPKFSGYEGAYRTHAIYDEETRDSETGQISPTQRGVREAKEFVEKNQK